MSRRDERIYLPASTEGGRKRQRQAARNDVIFFVVIVPLGYLLLHMMGVL